MPDADGFLSTQEMLTVDDKRIEIIEVPEWGGKVRLRSLEGTERGKLEAIYQSRKGVVPDFRERYVALCVCDQRGERVFTDAQVKELGKRSAAALDRIFDAATKLNRMRKEDVADLEGN